MLGLKQAVFRPSSAKASCDGGQRKAVILTRLNKNESLPVDDESSVGSRVSCLLHARSPFAILLAISKRIVDAIEGQPVRPNAHVREKILKCHPSLANSNSPTAVIFEVLRLWVRASADHAGPNVVLGRACAFCRMTVSCRSFRCNFCIEAPTTTRRSTNQRLVENGSHISAIAFAKVFRVLQPGHVF